MENSPFNRSTVTCHSPPPTPAPRPHLPSQENGNAGPEAMTTPEIQTWLSSIQKCLNDVCTIAAEGKLNSEQKLRITNLCRHVGHGTSQIAVQYQSLKYKAVQLHSENISLQEKYNIYEKLQDLQLTIDESTKPASPSYADMIKNGTNSYVQPNKYSSVAIYPKKNLKSSDETKTIIQNMINPEELKLHVRGVRMTRNGGVIISTETKEDSEKVKQSVQLASGFTVDEPLKRKPRIIVFGVPSSAQENEVIKCIYNQNVSDTFQSLTLDMFLSSVKLSHKSGKKDREFCNYVLEVTPDIRRALINKDRIFLNWSSCPIKDFTLVTRCFKCQQYGHAAKFCREHYQICSHCGDIGHAIKYCKSKTEAPKCGTCTPFKKPNNHLTGSTDCPAKKLAENRYINSIDYEGS